MNYCYNCGVKLIDPNQKFCIRCGINLADRKEKYRDSLRQYHKKYDKREGESYNDYLERINSPIKDKIATEEEIEREREAYINSYPNRKYRKENPISEREYDKAYERITDEEERARKEVIVEGMFGKPMASTEGNFIVDGLFGRPEYYIDGDVIRDKNNFGRPVYHIDGNYIREGMYGRPKYYIDGDLIRENNRFGRVVGRKRKF